MNSYMSVDLTPRGPILARHPMPSRAANQVVVSPILVGLCRADIKESTGTRPVRSDFGHEIAGVVAQESDPDVLPIGALVTLDPHIAIQRTSGFAERVVSRGGVNALREAFPVLSASLPLRRVAFIEPLACAWHSINALVRHARATNSVLDEQSRIAIVGSGTAAVLQAVILEYEFALRPTLHNRSWARLADLIARGVLREEQAVTFDEAREEQYDFVLISTSFAMAEIMEIAARIARPQGILLLFAGTRPGEMDPQLSLDLDTVRRTEGMAQVGFRGKPISIGGTYGATRQDFAMASESLENADGYPVERLIAREILLRDLPEHLRNLPNRRDLEIGKTIVSVATGPLGGFHHEC
jgi:cyclitol reductase